METDKKKDRLRQMSENLRRKAIETQEALDFARNANDISEESLLRLRKQMEATIEKLKLQLMQKADIEARLQALEKRTNPEDLPRTFAKPTTSEEAEVEAPSAEVRAEGFSSKTQEQILESGTLKEKIRLYICYLDEDNYIGSEKSLSGEDMKKIASSVKTAEDRKAVELYFREYQTLKKFGVVLRYYFKRFQTSFALLAKQLYLLDKYEAEVETYNAVLSFYLTLPSSEAGAEAEGAILHFKAEDGKRKAIEILASNLAKKASKSLSGEVILLDPEQMKLSLNLKEGKILSEIQKEAKEVEENLADFKAYASVALDYWNKSKIHYLPISIEICIENAEEERYIRYLVDNLRYFRSELNNRRDRGETITPEEYLLAVIPDYYEVKPSKDVLADCKDGIKRIEKSLRK